MSQQWGSHLPVTTWAEKGIAEILHQATASEDIQEITSKGVN
jgi:hypothetical protein